MHRLRFQSDRQYQVENQIYHHTMQIVMEVYYEPSEQKQNNSLIPNTLYQENRGNVKSAREHKIQNSN